MSKNIFHFLLLLLLLEGCASHGTPELSGLSPQAQAVVIKQYGGVYKVGNPYQIFGKWYYPQEDYNYSEIGMASWYGDDFHAKRTANGEKYDMNTLTAAHRTLPLPSIVKVTNLENGRSLVLRVNDRGPYAKDRIIDISRRGAQLLGYQTKGITKVRVEILPDESKALKAALLNQAASNASLINKTAKDLSSQDKNKAKEYYIQTGSFSDRDLALGFSQKLTRFGSPKIKEAYVNDRLYYRVRLGPVLDEDKAQGILSQVRLNGFHDARIVQE